MSHAAVPCLPGQHSSSAVGEHPLRSAAPPRSAGDTATAPKMPALVSSTLEAALKSSQISPGVTPKKCLIWKITHSFAVPAPALVKSVCILLWISCEGEVYCWWGRLLADFMST